MANEEDFQKLKWRQKKQVQGTTNEVKRIIAILQKKYMVKAVTRHHDNYRTTKQSKDVMTVKINIITKQPNSVNV